MTHDEPIRSQDPRYNPYNKDNKNLTPEEEQWVKEQMGEAAVRGACACCCMIPFFVVIVCIPFWAIWMWIPGLWQSSQAHNQELLDWGHSALIAILAHAILNPLAQSVVKGMCFPRKEGEPMTDKLLKTYAVIDMVESWTRIAIEWWMAYLAITGAVELVDMKDSGSFWFDFSMICMDAIMFFYFLLFVIFALTMIAVCIGVMAPHEDGWKGIENKVYGRQAPAQQGNYQQLNEGHQMVDEQHA